MPVPVTWARSMTATSPRTPYSTSTHCVRTSPNCPMSMASYVVWPTTLAPGDVTREAEGVALAAERERILYRRVRAFRLAARGVIGNSD